MTQENIVKGIVSAKSDKNFGLKIDNKWYNATNETTKEILLKLHQGNKVEFMVENDKDITMFMSVTDISIDDMKKRLDEMSQVLELCITEAKTILDANTSLDKQIDVGITLFNAVRR